MPKIMPRLPVSIPIAMDVFEIITHMMASSAAFTFVLPPGPRELLIPEDGY
jgi:hypothetical protein